MTLKIGILGSTGSIGTQALDVIAQNPDKFNITLITTRQQSDLVIAQALQFKPKMVWVADKSAFEKVKNALLHSGIDVQCEINALLDFLQSDFLDTLLTAVVGYAGLLPTIKAIEAGKNIALANKETLVVAGDLVMNLAKKQNVKILPVDSEHSAIFQCLAGEENNKIEKIILTASGGPFRGKKRGELLKITKNEALKHPNWTMGAKITIDSASLMNKGLEVIEAKWLFGVENHQIEAIIHPQSIIHSLVQFEDGSMKAQMGLPDMKLPIQYALAYPYRLKNDFPRFDFLKYSNLTFEKPDLDTFQNLALAFKALEKGGTLPCVLNASNEVAVEAFLQDKISFLGMSDLIADAMSKIHFVQNPTYEDYVQCDKETREFMWKKLKFKV
jgi:1-deoxy-D-xylulose-5-phosphate reductoisomerase